MKTLSSFKFLFFLLILSCTLVELESSEIFSLTSLTKAQQEIYILGIFGNSETDKNTLEIKLLNDCLNHLSLASTKTAFLIFHQTDFLKSFKETNSSSQSPLTEYVYNEANIRNFHSGNLHYKTLPDDENHNLKTAIGITA
ncbi:hypothetical protein H0X06_05025, partial [Candidatus Dependentiae bacterium]|nr:hypothetical protein [Candidatus Dependentiae bacterium]